MTVILTVLVSFTHASPSNLMVRKDFERLEKDVEKLEGFEGFLALMGEKHEGVGKFLNFIIHGKVKGKVAIVFNDVSVWDRKWKFLSLKDCYQTRLVFEFDEISQLKGVGKKILENARFKEGDISLGLGFTVGGILQKAKEMFRNESNPCKRKGSSRGCS